MIVVDDIHHSCSVTIGQLTAPHRYIIPTCDLPSFVGAQLVQVAHIVNALTILLQQQSLEVYQYYFLVINLRNQCREILSFIHPTAMEPSTRCSVLLERRLKKGKVRRYFERRSRLRMKIVTLLSSLENSLSSEFFGYFDDLRVLDVDPSRELYSCSDKVHDWVLLDELVSLRPKSPGTGDDLDRLFKTVSELIDCRFPLNRISKRGRGELSRYIEQFTGLVCEHLGQIPYGREIFGIRETRDAGRNGLAFNAVFAGEGKREQQECAQSAVASEEEFRTGTLLIETDFISKEFKEAREQWLQVLSQKESVSPERRPQYLELARRAHFDRFRSCGNTRRFLTPKGRSDLKPFSSCWTSSLMRNTT